MKLTNKKAILIFILGASTGIISICLWFFISFDKRQNECFSTPFSRVISIKEPINEKQEYKYLSFVTNGFHEKTHYLALYTEDLHGDLPKVESCELFNEEYLLDHIMIPEDFNKLKIIINNNKIHIEKNNIKDAPYYKVKWLSN